MGTRGTIQFRKDGRAFTVYQPSDSYPEDTVPKIQEFLKWNGCRCGDVEQTTSNFIFHSKIILMKHHVKDWQTGGHLEDMTKPQSLEAYFDAAIDNLGATHTGDHITDNDHQDEQYFYIVDLDAETIEMDGMKVKFGEKGIPKKMETVW